MGDDAVKSKTANMWIWIVLAAGLVVYLVATSIGDTQLPYVNAAELGGYAGRVVRVAGKVAHGGIEADGAGDVSIRFKLIDESHDTVLVEYTGVRPDAFREGAQAVVEGMYDAPMHVFNAKILQAKCPSKYEVGVPGATDPGESSKYPGSGVGGAPGVSRKS